MTALQDWMVLHPEGVTVADYEAMPEDICRQIEVVDGAIVLSPSPRRSHQRVAHRLITTLAAACEPHFMAVGDVDLRLRDVPLLNRRPDIVVYDSSVSDDIVLRPQHCILVVEVMSPGSVSTDQIDKPAEYAAGGIEHFWRVENYADAQSLMIFRYRLDPTTKTYGLAGVSTDRLAVTDPFPVSAEFEDLL